MCFQSTTFSSDLVERIEAKARENQKEYYGNRFKKVDSGTADQKSTTVNKRKQLADIAGVGVVTTDTHICRQ